MYVTPYPDCPIARLRHWAKSSLIPFGSPPHIERARFSLAGPKARRGRRNEGRARNDSKLSTLTTRASAAPGEGVSSGHVILEGEDVGQYVAGAVGPGSGARILTCATSPWMTRASESGSLAVDPNGPMV